MSIDGEVEFELEIGSMDFDPDDPRWAAQVRALLESLRHDAGEVRREATATAEGKKGVVAGIILALGTAGAFEAAVQIINSFLQRDTKRMVRLRRKVGDQEEIIELDTTGLSRSQSMELVERLWPASNG